VQFATSGCPQESVIGSAKAETPLLKEPLEGPVYLMSGFNHRLPDVVADLRGQIEILLDGRIDTVKGGLRTSFETVPDAPVTRFTLALDGGSKGLLENSAPLCSHTLRAKVTLVGQNGKRTKSTPALQTACGGAQKKRHRHRAGGSR
jgi:hypothetical protein